MRSKWMKDNNDIIAEKDIDVTNSLWEVKI